MVPSLKCGGARAHARAEGAHPSSPSTDRCKGLTLAASAVRVIVMVIGRLIECAILSRKRHASFYHLLAIVVDFLKIEKVELPPFEKARLNGP